MTRTRRLRRATGRAAAAGLATGLCLLATPGTASAAGTITPLLDCSVTSGNQVTLLLGYENTKSKAATYDVGGSSNHWDPAQYDGAQPATFQVGAHHGVYRVTMPVTALAGASWTVGSTTLTFADAAADTACPAGTSLPAEGNGTGIAVLLVAAGAGGLVLVRRARRSAAAAGPA